MDAIDARERRRGRKTTVAIDARSGVQLWTNPVDVTDCSEIGIGGGTHRCVGCRLDDRDAGGAQNHIRLRNREGEAPA